MGLFGHGGLLSKVDHFITDDLLGGLNDATGSDPGGPSGTPNMEDGHGGVYYSTDTTDNKTQQAIDTTAYSEYGVNDMFGSNTAYNENQENGDWWDRNKDWVEPAIETIVTTSAGIAYNNYKNKKNNEFNADQAQLNREWQEYMSNTAHQREMADLLATGLNPVNTATGGGGSTTPGGAQGTSVGAPYVGHSDMANTALSLAETMKVLNENKYISPEKKAQINNTIADTTLKGTQTEETHANTEKIKAETENIRKQFELMEISEKQMVLDLATAYVNADNERLKMEIERKFNNTWFGRNMKYAGYTISSLLPILGPIGQMTRKRSGGITINNN